jgi:archaellin
MALSGSVFATALIENGTISADRFNEVMHRGLDHVSGSMEIRGAVVVTASGAPLQNDTIQFTLGTFGTMPAIAMDPAQENGLAISYRDTNAIAQNVPYTARFGQSGNGDDKLDDGEVVTITIKVSDLQQIAGKPVLPGGKRWTLDLETAGGASLEFSRTQPSILTPVMAQH